MSKAHTDQPAANTPHASLPDEVWQRIHDEISRTIWHTMITLLGYASFCAIALGTPDINLIGGSIRLPFANTDVSYSAFLYVGPLVLVVLTAYLHIFVGELHTLGTRQQVLPLPYLFNIHRPVPRMLSGSSFYAVPPLLCYIFAWKALPWQDIGAPLVVLASLMTIILITLFAKRSRMRFFLSPRSLSELGASASWLGLAAVCIVALAAGAVNIAGRGHRVLDLERVDLQGRDLVDAELGRANLFRAKLQRADLSWAKLEGANLALANLERATLHWAKLQKAKLGSANLQQADLALADLSGADLESANLQAATLRHTDLIDTRLRGANLRGVSGLTCENLMRGLDWQYAYRERTLACGATIPQVND